MTAPLLELEGTWEEIQAQMPDFQGKRLHVTVRPVEEEPEDPLDATLKEIWDTVPNSSWEMFPPDFGDNMDHYLYGTPKRK